jgi:hypothetical protein
MYWIFYPDTEEKSHENPEETNKILDVHIESGEEREKVHSTKPGKIAVSLVLLMGAAVFLSGWIFIGKGSLTKIKLCLVDANFKIPLKANNAEIQILKDGQSPKIYKADSNACVSFEIDEEKLVFVVRADYYFTDTIVREKVKGDVDEIIELKQDDYAMLISYYSLSEEADWEKKRESLERMFSEEAEIIQLSKDGMSGMEIYNKEEFINKLTTPLSTLKNIVILNTEYKNKKITSMRFYIKK